MAFFVHRLCIYIYTCMGGGMRKTLNLKNGQHFPLVLWPKKCNFLHRLCIYIYGQWQANSGPKADCGKPSYSMGSGKPTAARRPTTASHHTLWAVASQQWPEGQLWQAITPYTYMHAHITHAINHEHVVAPLKCCCKYWTLYGCYVCVWYTWSYVRAPYDVLH